MKSEKGTKPTEKKVKVPTKIRSDKFSDVEFVNQKGPLKESFSIIVVAQGVQRQFTLHHPIGVTKLEPTDWVLSNTMDVEAYMRNQENPGKHRIADARKAYKIERAIEEGKILRNTNGLITYPKGKVRDDVVNKAKTDALASIEKPLKDWEQSIKKLKEGDQRPKKPDAPDFLLFLGEDDKLAEEELRKFLKSENLEKETTNLFPDLFETVGMKPYCVKQVRINNQGIDVDSHEIFDMVVDHIYKFRVKGFDLKNQSSNQPPPGAEKPKVPVPTPPTEVSVQSVVDPTQGGTPPAVISGKKKDKTKFSPAD